MIKEIYWDKTKVDSSIQEFNFKSLPEDFEFKSNQEGLWIKDEEFLTFISLELAQSIVDHLVKKEQK